MNGIRVRDDGKYIAFWCPGCRAIHGWLPINRGEGWQWNAQTLTLQPSVRHYYTIPGSTREVTVCHYYVRNGNIELLADSTGHQLRGTLPLSEAPPANYGGRESFGWHDTEAER